MTSIATSSADFGTGFSPDREFDELIVQLARATLGRREDVRVFIAAEVVIRTGRRPRVAPNSFV